MKLKNLFFNIILFLSNTSLLNAMSEKEIKEIIDQDSELISVQFKNENDEVLYSVDIPHSAIRLSTLLTNNFSCVDEGNFGITITLDTIHNVGFNELKGCLDFLKVWHLHKPTPEVIIRTLTKDNILKLINASDYLDFQEFRIILIEALHIKIRKLFFVKNKPLKALKFVRNMEDADLYEKLFNLDLNIENKFKQIIKSIFVLQKKLDEPNCSIDYIALSHKTNLLAAIGFDCILYFLDLNTGKCLSTLSQISNLARAQFSPDDSKLFLADRNDLQSIDLKDMEITRLPCHWLDDNLSISLDCSKYLTTSRNNIINLNDLANNTTIKAFIGHTNDINIGILSNDNTLLASSDDDSITKIWDVATGSCIQEIGECGTELAFSPDNKILAIAHRNLILWDIENKEVIFKINSNHFFSSLAFSPDGSLFAAGSFDNLVKVWDIKSRKCLQILNNHDNYVKTIRFSSDGDKLISGSMDRTINIYARCKLSNLYTLSTLLFLEYALFAKANGINQLPSEELYFELFLQLPENFQKMIIELFDQEALKNYLEIKIA